VQTAYSTAGKPLVAMLPSPREKYMYAVGDDSVLYCFENSSGSVEHVVKLHEKEVLGIAHHPHLNVFVSYSADSTLRIWKP